jgi:hypothetical protein
MSIDSIKRKLSTPQQQARLIDYFHQQFGTDHKSKSKFITLTSDIF